MDLTPAHWETLVRLTAFAGVLAILALAELLVPRRMLTAAKAPRWMSNLGLIALNTVLARLAAPVSAVAAALACEEHRFGVFQKLSSPAWLEVLLAIVLLDLAIYLQHVLFHAAPPLWRLHMVHHADLDIDVTTGLRFHTLEILLSLVFKAAVVAVLGASVIAVVVFEVVLNATSMFSHSNVKLPLGIDRVLRLLVVTPDMHRVHHSVRKHETNSNFGFNLSWWDYLFRTYRPQPEDGHEGMTIGLSQWRDEQQVDRLPGMLLLPLRRPE
jgi:sterol desaturase/sphingolipid hydroxylase (fatty acid hydroxylase superfamily)